LVKVWVSGKKNGRQLPGFTGFMVGNLSPFKKTKNHRCVLLRFGTQRSKEQWCILQKGIFFTKKKGPKVCGVRLIFRNFQYYKKRMWPNWQRR